MSNCRVTRNNGPIGGVFRLSFGTLNLTNCLFDNNHSSDNYAFMNYNGTSNQNVNITNCTITNLASRNGNDMNIAGELNVTNSVFRVNFSGTPTSVVNSITLKDCSSYGANNAIADPQLNLSGYPLTGSPCIDAGTPTGAPAKDMDGVTRPAGSGVDIGCYEFLDSDSDGIPDNIETAAGLNPNDANDASGDIDGDGITNLAEYQNGTDPGSTDSDGDGIADSMELESGYDPAVYTKVIYVDASRPDDTGDGLSLATAKQTLNAAVAISKDVGYENVILVASGTYTGTNNKNLDFGGFDIKLRSSAGAPTTIIDLENSGRLLYLHTGETKSSWVDGFTVKNGLISGGSGGAVLVLSSGLTIKNNIFKNNRIINGGYIRGGAVSGEGSQLSILNNDFIANSSTYQAGAIYGVTSTFEIDNCSFTGNSADSEGGIFGIYGSTVTMNNCRASRNRGARGGAFWVLDNANLNITNCLFDNIQSSDNHAFIYYSSSATVNITNCTITNLTSRNGNDMNIAGELNVTNSVFRVNFSGTPTSVVNSITLKDCSSYGANNAIADPQLNLSGYPLTDSPCIDAGTPAGAPATDMNGVTRPAGSGVDIGCYEFLDNDSDGIPDNIETAAGLNPNDASDASGDVDGDGITNLAEYQNGTDPGSTDSDADGISDDIELDLGYDPAIYTKIVYVDASKSDDSGDGLSLATAKQTILGAVNISKDTGYENVIMVTAGTYTGTNNKNLDFGGYDIKLRSSAGASTTIIDLENSGRFIYLHNGETKSSWIDGFTIMNGVPGGHGGALYISSSAMTIKNNIFKNNLGSDGSYTGGGAIYGESSNLSIINNDFIGNHSSYRGGALCSDNSVFEIEGCTFTGNSAAAHAGVLEILGGTITMSNCRVTRNNGPIGGVFRLSFGTLNLTNCLFDNNHSSDNYAFMNYNGTSNQNVNITNCTITNLASRNGNDMNIAGELNVTNSVFRVNFSGTPTSVVNSITLKDCSSYGANNAIADPQLNLSGYPLTGSPCIDAGTPTGAPAKDMDGVTRPAGSGVDIGCYEFLDSDSDGIPDNIETAAGLNPNDASDASGDVDGDGITNLAEYQNGTDPGSTDSDADGISDDIELDLGYDPAIYTKIVYVDASKSDDSGDGLSLATAKQTILGAVNISKDTGYENVIMVTAGTYTGTNNKNLDFGGYDIKLRSSAGASTTIIDLENSGRFIYLHNGETKSSWIDGFTIMNGVPGGHGGALYISSSAMTIKNNIFKNNLGSDGSYTGGGAIYGESSNLSIINNDFIGNHSSYRGGALCSDNSVFEIEGCTFTGNSAAAHAGVLEILGGTITMSNCRVTRNNGPIGGVFRLSFGTLNLTNCLFDNNHSSDNYAFMNYNGTSNQNVNITNCTITNLASRNGNDMNIAGELNVTNSVFRVNFSGTPTSVVNSITLKDCSSYGANNAIADPQLNLSGYPLTGSPCIDAGTPTGAPAKDMDGVTRPAGSGVDIGCYEFLDSDSDGIPDNIETAAGLNPNDASDASGDVDGDGITNLAEYQNGTDPGSTDSDADGISDDIELDLGYDPAIYTKIVYVDASKSDDSGDGLSLATAKQTILGAVNISKDTGYENVIMVTAGTYTGTNNKNLDFGGYDIKLRSSAGASTTIIDLENSGRFIYLHNGETKSSWIDGFTIMNGVPGGHGGALYISSSAMTIKNNIFKNNLGSNASYTSGGAIYAENSDLSILDNEFIANRSSYRGGAIAIFWCSSDIENCKFIGNTADILGGAIGIMGGTTTMNGCYASRNRSPEGGIFWLHNTSPVLTLTNCLFDNTHSSDNYAFMYYNGTSDAIVNITNCTITNLASRNGNDMNIEGELNVTNSVFRVNFSGTPTSVVNSITLKDCSSYGANNAIADPQLNLSGYPLTDSPCIDAGTPAGAPATDMNGVTRPAGSGVDIGCYEFLDNDSDGIPDNIETAAGLNPNDASDASGDVDGDGITNLAEYQNGTDPGSTDSDADGISDDIELDLGYDPAIYTKIVYVDASKSDDSGDGLSLATAKQTILGAVNISKDTGYENVIMVTAGTYTGTNNKNLDFGGYDIKLRSSAGASTTIIDLENSGRFIYLHNGETKSSWIDGFTIMNGVPGGHGGALYISSSAMTIKNNIFKNNLGSDGSYTGGGAIYGESSNLSIINNDFIGNHSSYRGGALCSDNSVFEIEGCTFTGNSAAAHAGVLEILGGTITMSNCRVTRNNGPIGGVFRLSFGTLNLTNCLFDNNHSSDNYAFMNYNGTSNQNVNITNCTITNLASRNGNDMNIAGELNVTNSVFRVNFSGTPTSVVNSITLKDCSSYGANNAIADPQLNLSGYPLTGSPCIDAGTPTGAPAKDMDGVTRPAGSGVDIGCYEFLDSDSDGIPDNIETAAGLNPNDASDASGDVDGDGITNLAEYQNGTDPGSTDSDADGISDDIELNKGYNPLVCTKIIYVDSNSFGTGDGLSLTEAKRSIKDAIDVSKDYTYDNVIAVASGLYTGEDNRNLDFGGYEIKLISISGAATTIIDLENSGRFIHLQNGENKTSVVDGFTITRGDSSDGGAIYINNCVFVVKNCIFKKNKASNGGAIYSCNSFLNIEKTTMSDNQSNNYGGAVYTNNTTLELDSCNFNINSAGHGAGMALENTNCKIINSLFVSNTATIRGGAFYVSPSASLSVVNCTMGYNDNDTVKGIYADGSINIKNCIIRDNIAGSGEKVINFSCALYDLSGFGTNNITADPLLNGFGCLEANSPCIDAGTATGAPGVDIIGSIRPAGNGIDIGCEEFSDTDGDGISDYYEFLCGGDVSASGDDDSDGLSNLYEYQNGLNALKADTDGDGMNDKWEIDNNLSAIRNDARGDADGDGLLNIEEYKVNSNPNSTDSDNDGKDDYWEAKEAFSDLTSADFDGTETTLLTVTGNNYTNSFGGWDAESTVAFARDRSGWIEYTLNVPAAGTYQLEVEATQHTSGSQHNDFKISCYVNGGFSSRKTLTAPYGTNTTARFFTPELTAGNATVRLVWDNVYRDTELQINSIKLISLGGADTDSDGKLDWTETRLTRMGEINIPEISKVSPVYVEGNNAAFMEQISIAGYYTPVGETPVDPKIRHAAFNKWYANVPIDPTAATSITVSTQDGALTENKQITWSETNVFTETETIIVRTGDSLLLNAIPTGGVNGTVTIDVEDNNYDVTGGVPVVHTFDNPGNIIVNATYIPNVGETQTKNITVKVVAAAFNGSPVIFVNAGRYWSNPNIGGELFVESDRNIQCDVYGEINGSRQIYIKADFITEAYVDARIYKNGPIIDSTKVSVLDATTHTADGYHQILYTFEDGSVMYEGYVVLDEVPDDIEVKVHLWGTGTVFEDGTREKTFTAANFNSNGELHYNVLAPANFTTCQSTYLYQDGVLLRKLQ